MRGLVGPAVMVLLMLPPHVRAQSTAQPQAGAPLENIAVTANCAGTTQRITDGDLGYLRSLYKMGATDTL